jgi:hypothetical protein
MRARPIVLLGVSWLVCPGRMLCVVRGLLMLSFGLVWRRPVDTRGSHFWLRCILLCRDIGSLNYRLARNHPASFLDAHSARLTAATSSLSCPWLGMAPCRWESCVIMFVFLLSLFRSFIVRRLSLSMSCTPSSSHRHSQHLARRSVAWSPGEVFLVC